MVVLVRNPVILLFSFNCLTLIAYCSNAGKIFLSVVEYPIELGESLTLFCNTSASGENQITWMKDNNVIMHYGASLDNKKYNEEHNADGVSLIISNTQASDVNVSYTCITETSSSQISLVATSENFLVPLTDENVNIAWSLTTGGLFTNISFVEVFPIPKCFLNYNDLLHLVNQSVTFHRHGLFYNGTIHLILRFVSPMCNDIITLICLVGIKRFTVGNITVPFGCNSTMKHVTGASNVTNNVYWMIAGILMPFLVFSTIICIYIRKMHLKPDRDYHSAYKISSYRNNISWDSGCLGISCTDLQHEEREFEQKSVNEDFDRGRSPHSGGDFELGSHDSGYQDTSYSSQNSQKREFEPVTRYVNDDMDSRTTLLQTSNNDVMKVKELDIISSDENTTENLIQLSESNKKR